jgi:hypothetical protein
MISTSERQLILKSIILLVCYGHHAVLFSFESMHKYEHRGDLLPFLYQYFTILNLIIVGPIVININIEAMGPESTDGEIVITL